MISRNQPYVACPQDLVCTDDNKKQNIQYTLNTSRQKKKIYSKKK